MTVDAIREARRSAKIATLDDFTLQSGVQEIMRETAAMNGKDYTVVSQFSSLLTRKLRTEFGELTLDEVQLAFHAGTEEEFGKNYNITYATLLIWLRGYVSDRRVALVYEEERKAAVRKRKASAPQMSETQIRDLMMRSNIEILQRRWKDIVEGRDSFEVPRAGALAFDYLVELGEIRPDSRRRKAAEDMAEIETPHPFLAALDKAGAAEVREASVRNIELRLFLRDLYRSGGVLRLPAVDNDMPNYL